MFQERRETGDEVCTFVPNIPYAFISSALTFWFPVIIMLAVYYKVYREAMKQKKSMERTNNIRAIPVNRNLVKNSFEIDKTTTELLEQEPHKANTTVISCLTDIWLLSSSGLSLAAAIMPSSISVS